MQKECPFCNDPAIKEREVVRSELVFAFLTNMPIVPVHVLVAPVRHVATMQELSKDERAAFFEMISALREVLQKEYAAEGFNFAWNEGALAGQSIPHLHMHVLPRKKGDTGITRYEPRTFLYRPGSRKHTPEEELLDVAATLRTAMDASTQ